MPEPGMDERWILAFESIHHVLAAERALLDQGVWCDLIPTPRDVRSDCGMVIELRRADWNAAGAAVRALTRPPTTVYRRTDRGHQRLDLGEQDA